MKPLTIKYLLVVVFVFPFLLYAQKAEQIYSITKVPMGVDYYKKQADLWKNELEKNKKNANAWYNYYRANRYTVICSNDTVRGPDRFKNVSSIIDEMGKYIPESFEFNYLKWLNSGNDLTQFEFLEKAYKIDPEREESYPDFVAAYELKTDYDKRDLFLRKWYSKGNVSPGYLYYNYNVLMSLKPNAIVLTVGDNDTYPLWILQAEFGIRKDVKVLNLSMLYHTDYMKKISNDLQFEFIDAVKSFENAQLYTQTIVQRIASNKSGRPLYTALTVDEKYTGPVSEKLYLVGLAYEYSTEKIDNIALLKKNMEQQFALDYLSVQFYRDNSEKSIKQANANYLVPMITLYEHYKLSNMKSEAERWKNLIVTVAKNSGQEQSIKDFIKD